MSQPVPMARLGDVALVNPSLSAVLPADEEVSFIPMSAVDATSVTAVDSETRIYSDVCKGYTPFRSGDVLVAKITPCFENGKIARTRLTRQYGFGSTEFHVVRPVAEQLDAGYLTHYLRQERIRRQGEGRMTGSAGQRRVPEHFVSGLEVPLPPLAEQRRIAAILDKADELRAKRRAALAQLETLTQAIFLDMFGDPTTNPKGWQKVPFKDLLDGIDSGWSPTCLDHPVEGDGWGVLKLGAVTWCEYDAGENKALPPDVAPVMEIEVQKGDLLFVRKNTYELVGACALVRETPPRLMMSDLIFRLRLRAGAPIDPAFLQQLLISPTKRPQVQKLAGGSAGSMPNISKGRLEHALIELPPLDLQRQFASRVNTARATRSNWLHSLRELDDLFASLQDRAFRGEL